MERCVHCGNYATPEAVERELRKREEEAAKLTLAVGNVAQQTAELRATLDPIRRLVDGKPGERSLDVRLDRIERLLDGLTARLPPLEAVALRIVPLERWWEERSKRSVALWGAAISGGLSLFVLLVKTAMEWVAGR